MSSEFVVVSFCDNKDENLFSLWTGGFVGSTRSLATSFEIASDGSQRTDCHPKKKINLSNKNLAAGCQKLPCFQLQEMKVCSDFLIRFALFMNQRSKKSCTGRFLGVVTRLVIRNELTDDGVITKVNQLRRGRLGRVVTSLQSTNFFAKLMSTPVA